MMPRGTAGRPGGQPPESVPVFRMSTHRNDPCPCGSGKKYKHCHGQATRNQPSPEEAAWRRLRSALDGFPTTMLRFIREVYGPGALGEAWAEFILWDDEEEGFDPDTPHLQVFMPWFFHHWAPDPADTCVADGSLHGRSPTAVLLERRGQRLEPTFRRYLEACIAAPFSFYEIVRADPGHGFLARDVLTGEACEVLERSASRTMRRGDIFFGQVVASNGITLMEACSVHPFPPMAKIEIIELRERIVGEGPPLTPEILIDWDIELREEYLERLDLVMHPPLPRLQNTDGEPLVFHRLSFEIPSAQQAFDALKDLALGETESELLESAELDADGHVRRVSFAWTAIGNPVHRGMESTVLGNIEIDGDRLVAEVNSARRAARLRELVETRCPGARHAGTDVETIEEALARDDADEVLLEAESSEDGDTASLAELPEVRDRIRAMMAAHYEDWAEHPLPALGGRSPMEAVGEAGGREKVEALITQMERDGVRMNPPLDEAITRQLRERLGLKS